MNAPASSENLPAWFAAVPGSANAEAEPRAACNGSIGPVGAGGVLPPVLDATCASRMMWFEKRDPRALFMDVREGHYDTSKGVVEVAPDVVSDFTEMPFPDESFHLVVFDPPHHTSARLGSTDRGDIAKKYGRLFAGWEETLQMGFSECFRVLKPNGVLIFKWFDGEIPISRVLEMTPNRPLFGHKTGKQMNTHWIAFLKGGGGAELGERNGAQQSGVSSPNGEVSNGYAGEKL